MDVINNKNLDVIRNMIIYENQQRLQNNEQLIDTKRKCLMYLNNRNEMIDEKYVPINWVKFCLGDEYFSVLKDKYCYDLNEFKSACQAYNITNIDSYKANHHLNNILPPYEYISSGFYTDIDVNFNINLMFSDVEAYYEF